LSLLLGIIRILWLLLRGSILGDLMNDRRMTSIAASFTIRVNAISGLVMLGGVIMGHLSTKNTIINAILGPILILLSQKVRIRPDSKGNIHTSNI